jgi:malate/lactate dehydrogenase
VGAYKQQQQHVLSLPAEVQQSSTEEVQRLVLQLDEQRAVVNSLTDELRKESAKVTEYRVIT